MTKEKKVDRKRIETRDKEELQRSLRIGYGAELGYFSEKEQLKKDYLIMLEIEDKGKELVLRYYTVKQKEKELINIKKLVAVKQIIISGLIKDFIESLEKSYCKKAVSISKGIYRGKEIIKVVLKGE